MMAPIGSDVVWHLQLALPGAFLLWLLRHLLPEVCVTTESWIAAAIFTRHHFCSMVLYRVLD
jgi:hypothetical protein